MALKFDKQGLANELLTHLKQEIEETLKISWKDNVVHYMRHNEFQSQADLDAEVLRQGNAIIAYLEANTYVLADSYGTGSLALTSNPGFETYRRSDKWNPARNTRAITGRPAGNYTDIFGKQHHSSGYFEGLDIEGWEFNNGYTINPVAPSYALQLAEQWLYKQYLPQAYRNAIQRTNFAKYLKES